VPNRALLEQELISAGFVIDRDRDIARRPGRVVSFLGG
jgi:hypothetical protein